MAFVICEPGQFKPAAALAEGECSLGQNGTLTVRAADLAAVKIAGRAVILADPDNMRIGLRALRADEADKSVTVAAVLRKNKGDSGTRRMNVRPGLRRLDLTASAAAGRYMLTTHRDELLFIVLTERRGAAGAAGSAGKATPPPTAAKKGK